TGVQTCALPIFFASTCESASRNVSRSSKPTRSITLPASIDSEVDTRISAARRARMKSPRTSLMRALPRLHGLRQQRVHLAIDILDIVLELEQHVRSEEHTSELQSRENLVCRLLLE